MEQQELMDIMTCLLIRGKENQHTFDEYSIWSIEDLCVINHIEILMMFPSQKDDSICQCLTFLTKYLTMNWTAMETNQSLKLQKMTMKKNIDCVKHPSQAGPVYYWHHLLANSQWIHVFFIILIAFIILLILGSTCHLYLVATFKMLLLCKESH